MIDLDAIAARDSNQFEMYHQSCHDRRALLAYVRELIAAARKVTCQRCDDTGIEPWSDYGGASPEPCPDCSALRALLPTTPGTRRSGAARE